MHHALGLIGVVLGVLIAFWLNSWVGDRKERKVAEVALANIADEIGRNSEALDTLIDSNSCYESFLDAFLSAANEEMRFLGTDAQFDSLKRLHPQFLTEKSSMSVNIDLYSLQDVAWRTALNSAVLSYIDLELIYSLINSHDG